MLQYILQHHIQIGRWFGDAILFTRKSGINTLPKALMNTAKQKTMRRPEPLDKVTFDQR